MAIENPMDAQWLHSKDFKGKYEEELTDEDIAFWEEREKLGLIVDDVPGGTDVSIPIRVDYMNGDYHKGYDLMKKNKVPIKYKTVMTIPPFHATIHIFPPDGVKAMKLFREASITMYKVKPTF
ncbi:MAG TPA: hypothetical protein ENI78_03055 [Euryarchaeota archaeon]|nr:hypothetical protein [Euryarchaeota archaeon]